jgi:predicted DNA-binding transcriptional regulator YafY
MMAEVTKSVIPIAELSMSFQKAEQLLDLATMAAARRLGITLDDVIERYEVSKRTAQRMLRTLKMQFPDLQGSIDNEGRKRWRLPPAILRDLMTLTSDELTALDLAIETLDQSSLSVEAGALSKLREKVLALVPRAKALRLETDHEALLEAQGLAMRPGPRPKIDPEVSTAVAYAIKACLYLDVLYRSRGEMEPRPRRIAPYGVLTGLRRYIVARPDTDPSGPMRLYRDEDITAAAVTDESFERDPEFDLRKFAKRAFGVFQNEDEYGEVVWRFLPQAAEHARAFEFHPDQVLEDQPDGSLVVKFEAAGHLEMCWYLYAWGDSVEVVSPERLKRLVQGFQRSDFPGLP